MSLPLAPGLILDQLRSLHRAVADGAALVWLPTSELLAPALACPSAFSDATLWSIRRDGEAGEGGEDAPTRRLPVEAGALHRALRAILAQPYALAHVGAWPEITDLDNAIAQALAERAANPYRGTSVVPEVRSLHRPPLLLPPEPETPE